MKYLLIFLILLLCAFNAFGSLFNTKNILMIVPPENFRDEELFVPKGIFEENGYKVEIASAKTDAGMVKGVSGVQARVNLLLSEVMVDRYDAVVLVGGPGAQIFWEDVQVMLIVQEAKTKHRIVGAICIAPVTLANAGLLKGKKATVFKTEAPKIKAKGAEYVPVEVVVDDGIVTASGPFESEEFAYKILEELQK
ncbi:MAG: DJ-1/PfpI family protein [Candidatus Omnitrophota bacterium]|nr:DJ-1/PfpI family protein [Candidatus Omnitrophota bacterium]